MTTIGPAAAPRRRSKIVWPDVASAEDMVRAVDEAVLAMDGFARGDVSSSSPARRPTRSA